MATFNRFLISLNLDPKACGSTLPMSLIEAIPAAKPKHRSCDECRMSGVPLQVSASITDPNRDTEAGMLKGP
jgi:hypothetical protein